MSYNLALQTLKSLTRRQACIVTHTHPQLSFNFQKPRVSVIKAYAQISFQNLNQSAQISIYSFCLTPVYRSTNGSGNNTPPQMEENAEKKTNQVSHGSNY